MDEYSRERNERPLKDLYKFLAIFCVCGEHVYMYISYTAVYKNIQYIHVTSKHL